MRPPAVNMANASIIEAPAGLEWVVMVMMTPAASNRRSFAENPPLPPPPPNTNNNGNISDHNDDDEPLSSSPPPLPLSVVFATAGYDHTIRFWDVVSGASMNILQHAESQVNCLALTRNKHFLAVAGNPAIRIFDTNTSQQQQQQQQQHHQQQSNSSIAPLTILEGHEGNVSSAGFSLDGRWMYSGGDDGILRIWDLRTSKAQHELVTEARRGVSSGMGIGGGGGMGGGGAAAGGGGLTTDPPLLQPPGSPFSLGRPRRRAAINSVALHPDQQELISVDDGGSMKIWDLRALACTAEMIPEEDVPLRSVSIGGHGGGQIATANNLGRVFIWSRSYNNTNTNNNTNDQLDPVIITPIAKIQAHQSYITKCVYSPDSTLLATASADGTARLWRLHTSASEGRIIGGLDLEQPPPPCTLAGHSKWVWDCAWSADSAYLVTGSSDNSARLWEVASGETVSIFTGHSKAITSVALNDLPL